MTKAELVEEVAKNSDLSKKDAEVIVQTVFGQYYRVAQIRHQSGVAWLWELSPTFSIRA